jgi:methylphosphotriester-DNA--protein-cysteine methyltransferase
MNNFEKKQIRQRIEAEQALRLLKKEIANIRYVKDWAKLVNCSKTKLNQLMKFRFGVTAKTMLKNTRLETIKETIKEHPDYDCFAVAKENGLPNECELYKFLSRNFETSFTELRFELLWKGIVIFKMDRENSCVNFRENIN